MSEPVYVIVCKDTNLIKTDGRTGMLCIFDTIPQAEKVKRGFQGTGNTKIVKCNMELTNQEVL